MINGHQDLWITGSRVYFQRDTVGSTLYPVIDLGRVTNASPAITQTEQPLKDGDGGIQRTIAVGTVGFEEVYEFRTSNFGPDNAALLFGASGTVAHTQATTPRVDITHTGHPGRLMKILDSTGAPVYGVTSVQDVKFGVTTLVAGTDYVFINPERGFIKFYEESATFPLATVVAAGNITVSYTPRAITDSTARRRINPQTLGCTSTGTAWFYWGKCGNQRQTVRRARVSFVPTGATFPDDNWADFGLRMTVLSDPTQAVPAGELINFLGDLPTMS